jgi:hypothetical protein
MRAAVTREGAVCSKNGVALDEVWMPQGSVMLRHFSERSTVWEWVEQALQQLREYSEGSLTCMLVFLLLQC